MTNIENDEYLKKCIQEYKECNDDNFVKKYILFYELSEAYYGHREESPEYLALSEEYAKKNIELAPNVLEEYKRKREENGGKNIFSSKDCVFLFSEDEDDEECQSYSPGVWYGMSSISRLRIIYTKSNRIEEAIKICDYGIKYYTDFDRPQAVEELKKFKEKLVKKLK